MPLGKWSELYAARQNFRLGDSEAFSVNGVEGLAVDVMSNELGSEVAGRIAVILPTASHLFVMEGVAPIEQWNQQAQADYEAVLNSVTFFAHGNIAVTDGGKRGAYHVNRRGRYSFNGHNRGGRGGRASTTVTTPTPQATATNRPRHPLGQQVKVSGRYTPMVILPMMSP